MQNMILVLHLLIAVVLVGAVLMQRSEGGALGMGGGGTGGLISGRGAADMMVRVTSWVGGLFFVTSLTLAVFAGARPADRSVIDEDGARKGGFNFQIPGLPGAKAPETTVTAPAAIAPLPAGAPVGAGPLVPAPEDAVTRAGPLTAQPVSPPDAPKAATPRTVTPVGASPAAGAGPAPVGAAPKTGAQAPMIPLPAASTPAPAPAPASATESDQSSVPAPPTPTREKTGPDE